MAKKAKKTTYSFPIFLRLDADRYFYLKKLSDKSSRSIQQIIREMIDNVRFR